MTITAVAAPAAWTPEDVLESMDEWTIADVNRLVRALEDKFDIQVLPNRKRD